MANRKLFVAILCSPYWITTFHGRLVAFDTPRRLVLADATPSMRRDVFAERQTINDFQLTSLPCGEHSSAEAGFINYR
jgi:hypothetical protein